MTPRERYNRPMVNNAMTDDAARACTCGAAREFMGGEHFRNCPMYAIFHPETTMTDDTARAARLDEIRAANDAVKRAGLPLNACAEDIDFLLASLSPARPSGLLRATAKGTAIDVDEWDRPLYVLATPANPAGLREAVIAAGERLTQEHGESCDCAVCLVVQPLVDAALAADEPGLDRERLRIALNNWHIMVSPHDIQPTADWLAAEYARLSGRES